MLFLDFDYLRRVKQDEHPEDYVTSNPQEDHRPKGKPGPDGRACCRSIWIFGVASR